jgi:RNA polymerase sigma-70 factor (ECF subfamily)
VLTAMSPSERAAFSLRHFEGRSIAEIGLALGMREGAAKQAVFRAVRKLREALTPLVEEQHETAH